MHKNPVLAPGLQGSGANALSVGIPGVNPRGPEILAAAWCWLQISALASCLSFPRQVTLFQAQPLPLLCSVWCSHVCRAGLERSARLTSGTGWFPCLVQETFLKLHTATSAVAPLREVHSVGIKRSDALVPREPHKHQALSPEVCGSEMLSHILG